MELIIFDCDGTLVDSELLCHLAMQYQLAESGIKYDATELMSKYRGVKLAETMASIAAEFSVTWPESFEPEYRQKVRDLFDKHLKPNDGVEQLLKSLTIPYCLASSAPMSKIEHALQVTGLAKYFDNNIFSSYEIGSWKPHPGIFLHAANTLNVEPTKCYVVEDSIVGLQAANSANMKSIHYSPDILQQSPLGSIQIQHMSELLNKIEP